MTSVMSTEDGAAPPAHREHQKTDLGVWDVFCLIVGIVVGVAIFKTPETVFSLVGDPTTGMLLWGLGAILALSGALCYSELATAYPDCGAEYVYLSRAYGRRLGFIFAWMQMCTILTGSVGAMAFVFSDYAAQIWPSLENWSAITAATAICSLTGLQLCGLRTGTLVQNLLTFSKIIALGGLLLAGLLIPVEPVAVEVAGEAEPNTWSGLGLALVFVLYAYGGWNDAATVTPEVRDHQRNMPRALLLGLGFIGILYTALNLAYLNALGFHGLRGSSAPAADVIERTLGITSSWVMSLIVMVSALGAVHGMMFAGCRMLVAVGRDYPLFTGWTQWNSRGVPVWSLLTLSGVSLILVLLVGTHPGQACVSWSVSAIGLPAPNWKDYGGGFDTLVAATAPIFWGFFSLSALAVIVLRYRDPNRPRPFQVPAYPWTPLIFFAMAAYMLWSSATYAGQLTFFLLPTLLAGVILSFIGGSTPQSDNPSSIGAHRPQGQE